MSIDFFSDEWIAVRDKIKEDIDTNLKWLEAATNEKEADKARGALKALRSLLALQNRKTPTQ